MEVYRDLRACGFGRLRILQLFWRGHAKEARDWYERTQMGKWFVDRSL